MIPTMNIIAWSQQAPWAEQRQVEQDLIISRALVELFKDEFLKTQLRFRGGTALNKLHFPKPLRYSEDIDLTTTSDTALKPILDRVHDILDPWLGDPTFERSQVAPKFIYRVEAEDKSAPIRLKLEINKSEYNALDRTSFTPFAMKNPWFEGKADIPTFSNEELLSTKLRALLQRNKGRDLLDLSHALDVFPKLELQKTVDLFSQYIVLSQTPISRAQAEQRMFGKLEHRKFLADVSPLLLKDEAERFDRTAGRKAFVKVFKSLVEKIPGKAWASTPKMFEKHELNNA